MNSFKTKNENPEKVFTADRFVVLALLLLIFFMSHLGASPETTLGVVFGIWSGYYACIKALGKDRVDTKSYNRLVTQWILSGVIGFGAIVVLVVLNVEVLGAFAYGFVTFTGYSAISYALTYSVYLYSKRGSATFTNE